MRLSYLKPFTKMNINLELVFGAHFLHIFSIILFSRIILSVNGSRFDKTPFLKVHSEV